MVTIFVCVENFYYLESQGKREEILNITKHKHPDTKGIHTLLFSKN